MFKLLEAEENEEEKNEEENGEEENGEEENDENTMDSNDEELEELIEAVEENTEMVGEVIIYLEEYISPDVRFEEKEQELVELESADMVVNREIDFGQGIIIALLVFFIFYKVSHEIYCHIRGE